MDRVDTFGTEEKDGRTESMRREGRKKLWDMSIFFRSGSVFAALFKIDMQESKTGKIGIKAGLDHARNALAISKIERELGHFYLFRIMINIIIFIRYRKEMEEKYGTKRAHARR